LLILIGFIGVVWLVGFTANRLLALKMGAVHTFTLPAPPRFLTDALALTKARQAMDVEGYDQQWKPTEAGKTSDVDGKPDKYLVRSGPGANAGTIQFTDSRHPKNSRIVHVELTANRVECQVQAPN